MPMPRVYFLVLGLASLASAQSDPKLEPQSDYSVCQTPLAVGEVPNSPFLADQVDDSWTIAPEGGQTPVALPEAQAGVVARDRNGRVMFKSLTKIRYSNSGAEGESPAWSVTICDPVAATVTRITYGDVFYRGVEPSTEKIVPIPAGIAGNAVVRPQVNFHTTAVFKYWHYTVRGRDNLGPEIFEGLPAFRFRLHSPQQKERSIHDVVNSDELFVQLVQTTWGDEPGRENEKKITHLRRVDPPLALFDIPQGVHIQDQRTSVQIEKSN
jgi:hypothetical protein